MRSYWKSQTSRGALAKPGTWSQRFWLRRTDHRLRTSREPRRDDGSGSEAIPSRKTVLNPSDARSCGTLNTKTQETSTSTGSQELPCTSRNHWMSTVEAKDALHVEAPAWFTAWQVTLAWQDLFATLKRQKQTSKLLKYAVPSPQCQMPDKVGDSAQRHLDQPHKMRRITTEATSANPNQV